MSATPAPDASSTAVTEAANSEDVLIILPVRNTVLFPQVVLPIAIQRERSVAAAQEAVKSGRKVGLLLQRDAEQDDPAADGLYQVGTIATIVRYVTAADGTHHLICQGERRFSVLDFVSRDPFMVARITTHPEPTQINPEIEARALRLRELATEALQLLPQSPTELANAIQGIDSIPALADLIASFLDLKPIEKQQVLAAFDLQARLDLVLDYLRQRVEVLRIAREIDDRTKAAFDGRQKEAVLRERLRQIQKELGGRGRVVGDCRVEGIAGQGGHAERDRRACAQPNRAAGAHGGRQRRIFDDANVSGVDVIASLVEARQGGNRHR